MRKRVMVLKKEKGKKEKEEKGRKKERREKIEIESGIVNVERKKERTTCTSPF